MQLAECRERNRQAENSADDAHDESRALREQLEEAASQMQQMQQRLVDTAASCRRFALPSSLQLRTPALHLVALSNKHACTIALHLQDPYQPLICDVCERTNTKSGNKESVCRQENWMLLGNTGACNVPKLPILPSLTANHLQSLNGWNQHFELSVLHRPGEPADHISCKYNYHFINTCASDLRAAQRRSGMRCRACSSRYECWPTRKEVLPTSYILNRPAAASIMLRCVFPDSSCNN